MDVSAILSDGQDGLAAVLRNRTGALLRREVLRTTAGTLTTYFRDSTSAKHPHNDHAQRLLRRLGLDLDHCPGTFLFLGSSSRREVGLSPTLVDLVRREHAAMGGLDQRLRLIDSLSP